jgi:LemA protein
MWIWVALGAVALLLLWGVLTYNSLVRHRNWVGEGWSGIDVQLRRRHDLVPNLIEVAEAFRVHERNLLERVAEARTDGERAAGARAAGAAESRLGRALVELFAVAENYPDLKSDQVFLKLQHDLVEVEDHLQYARRYYNGTVRNLNNRVQIFPSSLIARLFGFRAAEFFEIDDDAVRTVPEVTAA